MDAPNWFGGLPDHTSSELPEDVIPNAFDWPLQIGDQSNAGNIMSDARGPSEFSSFTITGSLPGFSSLNGHVSMSMIEPNARDDMAPITASKVLENQSYNPMIESNNWILTPVMNPAIPVPISSTQIPNQWNHKLTNGHTGQGFRQSHQHIQPSMSQVALNNNTKPRGSSATASKTSRASRRNHVTSRKSSRRRWSPSRFPDFGKRSMGFSTLALKYRSPLICSPSNKKSRTDMNLKRTGFIEENIPSLSSIVAQRKATHLFKKLRAHQEEVIKLEEQLRQVFIDEQRYGDIESSDSDLNLREMSSSRYSASSSEFVHSQDMSDDTSFSSTPRQTRQPGESSDIGIVHRCLSNHCSYKTCSSCWSKPTFSCTLEGCCYSSHSFTEWKRHEEGDKHYPQERFMCWECLSDPPLTNVNGLSICRFCHTPFSEMEGDIRLHYLQCEDARKHATTFPRKDRLNEHLRIKHLVRDTTISIENWKYDVESEWPRQCPFCETTFESWDERMDHIAKQHYRKRPFFNSKDFHSGGSRDDDDDDDDDGSFGRGREKTPTMSLSQYKSTSQNSFRQKQTSSSECSSRYQQSYTMWGRGPNFKFLINISEHYEKDGKDRVPSRLSSVQLLKYIGVWITITESPEMDIDLYETPNWSTNDNSHPTNLYPKDSKEAMLLELFLLLPVWNYPYLHSLIANNTTLDRCRLTPSTPVSNNSHMTVEDTISEAIIRIARDSRLSNKLNEVVSRGKAAFIGAVSKLEAIQSWRSFPLNDFNFLSQTVKYFEDGSACPVKDDHCALQLEQPQPHEEQPDIIIPSKARSRESCLYSTCSTTFINAKVMRKHMEESHKPRKTCPFEGCSTPSYQTRRRSRLLKHFRDVHGLTESDAKNWGRWVENNTPYFLDEGQQGKIQELSNEDDGNLSLEETAEKH